MAGGLVSPSLDDYSISRRQNTQSDFYTTDRIGSNRQNRPWSFTSKSGLAPEEPFPTTPTPHPPACPPGRASPFAPRGAAPQGPSPVKGSLCGQEPPQIPSAPRKPAPALQAQQRLDVPHHEELAPRTGDPTSGKLTPAARAQRFC